MKLHKTTRIIWILALWMIMLGNRCQKYTVKEASINKLLKLRGDTMRVYLAKNYKDIGEFNSGLARVKNKSNKYGFIDTFGRLVIPDIYDKSDDFDRGWAKVSKDNSWGFIDTTGRMIIPFEIDGMVLYTEVGAPVDSGRVIYYMERKDKPSENDKVGNMPQRKNAKERFIHFIYDKKSKNIILFDLVDWKHNKKEFSNDRNVPTLNTIITKHEKPVYTCNRAKVWQNNKYGYMDTTEKLVIPAIFDNAIPFDNGMAQVSINGKWGYIDTNGKMITPIKYDETTAMVNGMAIVMYNGKRGYINSKGKEVIALQYEGAMNFTEGLAAVKQNDKWGFIDNTGKLIVPIIYDNVDNFDEGKSRVMKGNRTMYIDKKGNCVINCPVHE